jgi:hypothetical protein
MEAAQVSCQTRATELNRGRVVGNHSQVELRSRIASAGLTKQHAGAVRGVQCNLDSFHSALQLTSTMPYLPNLIDSQRSHGLLKLCQTQILEHSF